MIIDVVGWSSSEEIVGRATAVLTEEFLVYGSRAATCPDIPSAPGPGGHIDSGVGKLVTNPHNGLQTFPGYSTL